MKTATASLIALLNAAGGDTPLYEWDFYTITLADGTILRYGTAPFVIAAANATIWNPPNIDGSGGMWFNGITWTPGLMGLQGDGAVGHWKIGLDADTWGLVYTPRDSDPVSAAAFPDKINDVPWLEAARAGALDDADVIVSTAYYDAMPTGPISLAGVSPIGTLITARGTIGAVDCGDAAAYITVTDYRATLNRMMPRNLYQGSCRHRLYDARCTLLSTNFDATGIVAAGSDRNTIVATGAVAAPGGSATYRLGVLTMTSGLNNGFQRLVVDWNGGTTFELLVPLPFAVSAGDTFSVAAGCDKRFATCQLFANQANFGGEPYIPLPETSIG